MRFSQEGAALKTRKLLREGALKNWHVGASKGIQLRFKSIIINLVQSMSTPESI